MKKLKIDSKSGLGSITLIRDDHKLAVSIEFDEVFRVGLLPGGPTKTQYELIELMNKMDEMFDKMTVKFHGE